MEEIKAAYDRWARGYDAEENRTRNLDQKVMAEYEDLFDDAVVLECGCGTGKNTAMIAQRCLKVVGIDFSEQMLAVAGEKLSGDNVVFLQQDLNEPWMIEDGVVDTVVFNLVLEHIEDLKHVFSEAMRVLKDGGGLLISEYHPQKQAEGKGAKFMGQGGAEEKIPFFPHTADDFAKAAEPLGFEFMELNDWTAEGEDEPRVLSMLFVK
ncbi:class I SAM-dependent methyltransferase [Poriferisphaera sp. WC338]|uniref:class I SAM-dependent methyltransferase n=1 Tax=Poriferisphaera sp. WC338 TaxID=3425129 RepID=UPI003D81B4C7